MTVKRALSIKVRLYSVLHTQVNTPEAFDKLKRNLSLSTGIPLKSIGRLANIETLSSFRQLERLAILSAELNVPLADLIEVEQSPITELS